MQGNRGGSHPSFNSDFPFPEFGHPFQGFEGSGGLGGRQRSLVSSFIGGRDPFDDPFFTNPFGGRFESNLFGARGSPFMDMLPPPTMIVNHSRTPERTGPIIEELNSDEEKDESSNNRKENPRNGRSSRGPDADDENNEVRRSKYLHNGNASGSGPSETKLQPQRHSFTYRSSTVSYGGTNGTYYTSSMTRQSGNNGVVFEECKEADSSTMQATHRISRGIHNEGHSVTRKLGSDGTVDTIQTLHNLNEDQLPQFEKNWKGTAGRHLPRWSEDINSHGTSGSYINQGGTLPSTQHHSVRPNARERVQLLQGQHSGSVVMDTGAKNGHARQRGRG